MGAPIDNLEEAAMTTQVKFASKAGGRLEGALAEPAGTGKAGSLIVVHEWWGLSDHIKAQCDRFAQAGFFALAPDLFHGTRPATQEQAAQAMMKLDKKTAAAEIGDAVAFLRGHARGNGRVAIAGFCMGGALTLAAARYVDGLAAAVPFYGLPDVPADEFAKVRVPIQAHFARKDDWAKASVAEEIQRSVRSGGGQMDLYVYESGHAFMRSTDPQVYDAANAKVAWDRSIEFLKKHLS
jgi:carboxymethylenebutenolidase